MADMRLDPSTQVSPPTGCEPMPSELDRAVEVTRSLVDAMEGTSVSRLVVSAGAIRIEVERSEPRLPAATLSEGDAAITTAQNGNAAIAGPSAAPAAPIAPAAPTAPVSSAAAVRALLVGVFYRRPEPGKPPMVPVGDRVEAGQPLAIVEAMKMIQVEHPVTEQVMGVDLVTAMIRVAAGERLPWSQGDLVPAGHALECRINAEDPSRGWAVSTGRITRFRPPAGPHVRVDTHVHDGYEVGPHYDSLLAKVIVVGGDRDEAIQRMRRALREFRCEGIATTLDFHRALLDNLTFCAARHRLDFVERHCDPDGRLIAEVAA